MILLHGQPGIQKFQLKHGVETTKGILLVLLIEEFSISQDPLYRALVALGLGHKIQINVMATLEVAHVSPEVFGICQLSWVIIYIRLRERSS